jgi:hypothetical protein
VSEEFAGWHRVGGRQLQFYATNDEIAEWLSETLPPSLGPYTVLGQEWEQGRWQAFEHPLDDVLEAFALHAAGHWVRSSVLSPALSAADLRQPEDIKRLSYRGLIQVHVGREGADGRLSEASIGIVDRIRHETTGRERRRPGYLRIFERLRRSMRKRLVVETVYTFPDGTVTEHWPMTARAAEAHARGDVQFDARPVGLRE